MYKKIIMVFIICLLGLCFTFTSCDAEIEEPLVLDLISLQSGSPGYEGDGAIHGLRNGSYIIRHTKETVYQEKDPLGNIFFRNAEDWYAVDDQGLIFLVSSSICGIPAVIENNFRLDLEPSNFDTNANPIHLGLNTIRGLTNGERYTVYKYGELSNGDRVGRLTGDLPTRSYNAFLNLKNIEIGRDVYLADQNEDTNNRTGGLSSINHWVVLVDTPLSWTEFPQSVGDRVDASITLEGRDFDIEIRTQFNRGGLVTVHNIAKEGQQYFIMTGSQTWRGWITLKNK
jgi:hypothetical protein